MKTKKQPQKKLKKFIGRPPIFTPKEAVLIKNLMSEGISVRKIAKILECNHDTVYDYCKKNKLFSDMHKEGRENLISSLECALYKKAKGFHAYETHLERDKDGNLTKKIVKKHFAPDTGALVFALTNLKENKWKNKRFTDNTHSGTITVDDKRKKAISDRFSRYGDLISSN